MFRIEKSNQFSDNTTPIPKYVQDGLQINQGLELTLTGKATENLTLVGGTTFMDTKVKDANIVSIEGKKPTQTPENLFKIYVDYKIPTIDSLSITGGAYYNEKSYRDNVNRDCK